MQLIEKMFYNGNWLFKYRGQVPVVLFIILIPIIINTSYYNVLNNQYLISIQYISLIISFIGLSLRWYSISTTPSGTSGRNRNYQIANYLNTKGVYSIVRHPLYFANYLIWLGIAMYSISYIFIIIVTLLFILHYERIILVEEKFLLEKFGEKYKKFCREVPCFFPSFKKYKKSGYKFSIKTLLRQEYSSFLSTIISFIYIDYLINIFFIDGEFEGLIHGLTRNHIIILLIGVFITFFLKIIKTYTHLLNENQPD